MCAVCSHHCLTAHCLAIVSFNAPCIDPFILWRYVRNEQQSVTIVDGGAGGCELLSSLTLSNRTRGLLNHSINSSTSCRQHSGRTYFSELRSQSDLFFAREFPFTLSWSITLSSCPRKLGKWEELPQRLWLRHSPQRLEQRLTPRRLNPSSMNHRPNFPFKTSQVKRLLSLVNRRDKLMLPAFVWVMTEAFFVNKIFMLFLLPSSPPSSPSAPQIKFSDFLCSIGKFAPTFLNSLTAHEGDS